MHDVIDKEKFKPMGWDEKRSKIEIFPSIYVATVQLNSNLTLAHVRLAETRHIFNYTRELAASALTSLW